MGKVKRTQPENRYYIVGADVPSPASTPTLIATPSPTFPPKEVSMFVALTFGSPTVPPTGVALALAVRCIKVVKDSCFCDAIRNLDSEIEERDQVGFDIRR